MSMQQNIEAQQRFGEAVNSGRLEAILEVVSPLVIDHDPAADQGPGPQGFVRLFTAYREAFPDLKVSPNHLTADDESIALAYIMSGTHKGSFLGIPPSGKTVRVRGVQIARFAEGKMVERWGSSDQLGLLEQIGAWPARESASAAA
jgi:steroid delta-isomerase-like uncharacterized protein